MTKKLKALLQIENPLASRTDFLLDGDTLYDKRWNSENKKATRYQITS